jgi:hypothetical protein
MNNDEHLNGTTWWIFRGNGDDFDGGSATVRDAIISDAKIAFDTKYDGNMYTIVLTPAEAGPSWWVGKWSCREDRSSGTASARLYRSTDGGVVLVGRWQEDGEYTWFTEMR